MKTQHESLSYIVLEKQFHPLVGRAILCPSCHDSYRPKDDERTCSLILTEAEACDGCGRSIPAWESERKVYRGLDGR